MLAPHVCDGSETCLGEMGHAEEPREGHASVNCNKC